MEVELFIKSDQHAGSKQYLRFFSTIAVKNNLEENFSALYEDRMM